MSLNENLLDQAAKTVLDRLTRSLNGSGKSPAEIKTIQSEATKILQQAPEVIGELPPADVLSSAEVNQTSNELDLGLQLAFAATDLVDSAIQGEQGIHQGFLSNASDQADQIEDRLTALEQSLQAKLNPTSYIESFRTNANFETEARFYTDRYGEDVNEYGKIRYNAKEQSIALPETLNLNALAGNGLSNATASIPKQVGGSFLKIRNDHNDLQNILDLSEKTFWRETILADDRIQKVSFGEEDEDFGGALCEIQITLESVRKINELLLSPYGEYPMSLISLTYTETDDANEPKKEFVPGMPIPPYSSKAETEYPLYMDRPISFKFKDTVVKNLFVRFTQFHYTRESLLLAKTDILKSDIWNRATEVNEKRVYDNQLLFSPLANDTPSAIPKPVMKKIEQLRLNSPNDIHTELILEETGDLLVEKYAYTYGFYNIGASFKDYSHFGIYVSRPISSYGAIREVRINTEEFHPQVEHESQTHGTDIEYYLTHKEFPEADDWLPILPTNKKIIESELLQLQNDHCPLRFSAKEVQAVYLFSRKLTPGTDYVLKTVGGVITGIHIPNYNFNGIYTVTYIPTEESKVVRYSTYSAPLQNTERIAGRYSNAYPLTHYPDHNHPTEINVTDITTGLQLQEKKQGIVCVTNKEFPAESYKNFSKNAPALQYYIHQNVLYFNRSVGPEMVIEANYYHYVSSVRLKAIIRRNTYDRWMTPVVKKINYNFVTG